MAASPCDARAMDFFARRDGRRRLGGGGHDKRIGVGGDGGVCRLAEQAFRMITRTAGVDEAVEGECRQGKKTEECAKNDAPPASAKPRTTPLLFCLMAE